MSHAHEGRAFDTAVEHRSRMREIGAPHLVHRRPREIEPPRRANDPRPMALSPRLGCEPLGASEVDVHRALVEKSQLAVRADGSMIHPWSRYQSFPWPVCFDAIRCHPFGAAEPTDREPGAGLPRSRLVVSGVHSPTSGALSYRVVPRRAYFGVPLLWNSERYWP